MAGQTFKTPEYLMKDSETGTGGKNVSSKDNHPHPVILTPITDSEQDMSVRRSLRNAGKESIVQKFKMSLQGVYPGSEKKPNTRRSFRTPIQTIPLRIGDGKGGQLASKSFIVIPDQEDMTPRSNIEGFLTMAESEQRTEVSRTAIAGPSVGKSFKTPEQPIHTASQRILASDLDITTPGSRLTPRTNIWNLLNLVKDQAQTPTVRPDNVPEQPSDKTNVSAVKHREWGQEVILSPLYRTHASEDSKDSPSMSIKSVERNHHSFHIQVPQAAATKASHTEQTVFDDGPMTAQSEDFVNTNDHLDSVPTNVLPKNLDTDMSSDDVYGSTPYIAEIDMAVEARETITRVLDNGASENILAADIWEGTGAGFRSSSPELLLADLGVDHDFSMEEHSDNEEQDEIIQYPAEEVLNRDGGTLHIDEGTDAGENVASSLESKNADGANVRENIVSSQESENADEGTNIRENIASSQESENADEGTNIRENIASSQESENVDEGTNIRENIASSQESGNADEGTNIRENIASSQESENADEGTNIRENIASSQESENADEGTNIRENIACSLESENADEGTNIRENIVCSLESENAEENADAVQEECRKDKNLGVTRTSFSSKHGAISFSATPKKNAAGTIAPLTPNASVYDLSDTSCSSVDMRIPRRRNYTEGSRKGRQSGSASAQRKRSVSKGATEAIEASRQSTRSSQKRSKLSYSEWKSLQKGKDSSNQAISSFLDSRPTCSSTPSVHTKRLHSTKIQTSILNYTADNRMSDTLIADPIADISPIQPDVQRKRQNRSRSRHDEADVDTDKDYAAAHVDGGSFHHQETRRQVGQDEGSSDSDSWSLSPLATPHIDMTKKTQVPSIVKKLNQKQITHTGASGFGQKRTRETTAGVRESAKRRKRSAPLTAMPRRSVKFFAERHTTMKLSRDAVEEIEQLSELFWDNTFKAVEAYAAHAGRKVINDHDVILLMKTQRLVTDDPEDLYDKIREYLPMELRSELIPVAKP